MESPMSHEEHARIVYAVKCVYWTGRVALLAVLWLVVWLCFR